LSGYADVMAPSSRARGRGHDGPVFRRPRGGHSHNRWRFGLLLGW